MFNYSRGIVNEAKSSITSCKNKKLPKEVDLFLKMNKDLYIK